jgi:hypothetical protein
LILDISGDKALWKAASTVFTMEIAASRGEDYIQHSSILAQEPPFILVYGPRSCPNSVKSIFIEAPKLTKLSESVL